MKNLIILATLILSACATQPTNTPTAHQPPPKDTPHRLEMFRTPSSEYGRPKEATITILKDIKVAGWDKGHSLPTMVNTNGSTWINRGTEIKGDAVCGFYSESGEKLTLKKGMQIKVRPVYYENEFAFTTVEGLEPKITIHCGEFDKVKSLVNFAYKNIFTIQ